MKTLISSIILVTTLHTLAQVYTPPATPQPDPNAIPTDSRPTPAKEPPSSVLGQEIPLLDPSAETITVGGVAIPIGDNRFLKARFEKYLNQAPENDDLAREYRANIDNILAAISPFRSGGPNLQEAFKMLPIASTYPGDANLCGVLAEAVYMALLSKTDVTQLNALNKTIEEEKQQLIQKNDWVARTEKDPTLGDSAAPGQGGNGKGNNRPATNPGRGVASLKYAEGLRRIAEIELLKKANIARTEAQTLRTKTQYQVNMIQWFMQRRYEHVLMAARFYNQIWKDGDAALRVDKNSDVSKLFSESIGISPTVTSLDSLSNEAIREVTKYVEAFDLLLSRDELHSASQRLMEAYAIGEYLSPVTTLSLEKKLRIATYVRELHELYGTLQARDYTRGKELLASLKKSAKDFPSSKIDSAIAAHTFASDLAIEEAKAHLLARDSAKASASIKTATEYWPTNPKLEEFRTLLSSTGVIVTVRNDFDRLLAEGNYREIAKRQYEFVPAIEGDATRLDAFKQIIENLREIEGAIGKANEFSGMGQSYSAWEQLAEIRERFPDDPRLGRELELLAPKVADFTLALDKARQFETRKPKQTGSALSWYLKARSIYPQSKQAEKALQLLIDEILIAEK
jgi:hypothetical protein